MHIGARFHLKATQSIEYNLRHLGRRGVIQIVKPLVSEAWKLSFECSSVKRSFRQSDFHVAFTSRPLRDECGISTPSGRPIP